MRISFIACTAVALAAAISTSSEYNGPQLRDDLEIDDHVVVRPFSGGGGARGGSVSSGGSSGGSRGSSGGSGSRGSNAGNAAGGAAVGGAAGAGGACIATNCVNGHPVNANGTLNNSTQHSGGDSPRASAVAQGSTLALLTSALLALM